ncbi:MAG: hypothetical protein GEV13_26385 [Rhodospirillales bacterium]|nr:hypothetical protein [Rhodospirillales bacterium]
MAAKIVDVFLKDELVESYELLWNIVNAPLFDQDFIDRARARMRVDGYTGQQIAEARFSIRPATES